MFIQLHNSYRLKSWDNDGNSALPMVATHDHYRAESHPGHHHKPLETDNSYVIQEPATKDTVIQIQKKRCIQV